jgi:hypothetical protein
MPLDEATRLQEQEARAAARRARAAQVRADEEAQQARYRELTGQASHGPSLLLDAVPAVMANQWLADQAEALAKAASTPGFAASVSPDKVAASDDSPQQPPA